jgi:hypothetical protein
MVTLAAQFYLRDKPFQYLTVLSDIGAALTPETSLLMLLLLLLLLTLFVPCCCCRAFEAAHQELC